MNGLVIDVAGINKRFGDKHVVKDLSLQVRQGEIYGFLGPNGSGKTTSIRMLCGLLTPDSGRGTCLGLDVLRESAAIKRQVGYMTQKFSLWDDLSIGENLDFVARMFGMRERQKAVDRSLDELGLSGRRQQLAGTLSGGWKQRLALAACLLHQPRLLLLDEPTAGVDPKARRDFWEEIQAEDLRGMAGVDQVASFGATLHVSGQDGARLQASLQTLSQVSDVRIVAVAPSLEDAFIHLMQHAQDPFAG
ncbi:MAG: putative ABC transporter ATP-binding protein YbhF [Candidatus Accumulibacter phosphatis]|uniref:Putative ABC transporter ATP-binding protein YbhF n=1 Tax=Candidatus Accumulibacter phosphatis TaxID=327160 RepID=A0A080LZ18_9PROT|nr:MAG: putative ABC transporter ATP-binding protein YbhF [Candidatus Accumulibacter phosphatis]